MASSVKPGHTKPYTGNKKLAVGGWSKKASREGSVEKHPNGKFVARKAFYTDSYHDKAEDAHAQLAKWNTPIKKFSDI